MDRDTAINALADRLEDMIGTRSYEFGESLVLQYRRRGHLSEKQWHWVFKLVTPPAPTITEKVDAAAIIELFDVAGQKRKYPKIVAASNDITLRFTRAGQTARFPGSINLIENNTRTWLGRIHTNGDVEIAQRAPESCAKLALELVREFAQDPMGTARRSGHINGECCFCAKSLTDERSRHAGYGPTCAKTFGLEWGGDLAQEVDVNERVWFHQDTNGDSKYRILSIDSAVGEVDGELAWVAPSNAHVLAFDSIQDAQEEWAWAKLNG